MKLKYVLVVLGVAICLTGCKDDISPEQAAQYCKPVKVTETESGMALYRVDQRCPQLDSFYDVYFTESAWQAGSYTFYRESAGKGSRPVEVP